MVQWLKIHLPIQGTRVQALVREDPTCRRATKPVHHNYWACALELTSHNYWAHVPQLLKPMHQEPMLHNKRSPCTAAKSSPCSPQLEKACTQQWRPNTAKNKKKTKKTINSERNFQVIFFPFELMPYSTLHCPFLQLILFCINYYITVQHYSSHFFGRCILNTM